MTVQTRWSLQTIALLTAGISLSLAASYAVQLNMATYAAAGWLSSSLTKGFEASNGPTLVELSMVAKQLADTLEVRRRDDASVAAVLSNKLSRISRHEFWGLIGSSSEVLTSHPSCSAALRRNPVGVKDNLLVCDGMAVFVAYAPVEGAQWSQLVVGSPLDGAYVDRLSLLYNTEVEVVLGDVPIASSLRDTLGQRQRIRLDADEIDSNGSPRLTKRALGLMGYRGFTMGDRPSRIDVGPRDRWFISTRRIASDGQVALAMFVPVEFMTIGAKYGTVIMIGVDLVVLALMALLVWRLALRFSRPILALSASARAVAAGDLTQTVPVPSDVEMGGFCQTYNQMLQDMQTMVTLQKSLARASGMSEIATGVLHNVGNVLNSINVAAAVSLECSDGLKLASLERAVGLFAEHRGDLALFLSEDPRGRQLPLFLQRLSEQLARQRGRLGGELRGLMEKVEHVKQIVTSQQLYARGGMVLERCSLSELVDDALRMEATALHRSEIVVTSDVADVGLNVDRHKMLQILVNLISNAKHAVASVRRPRTIRISTAVTANGVIELVIEDNGVGIAAADAPKIFGFGFTTKAEGHGFGLHHSAIAAKEMGGSLNMRSEGAGRGATFILALPFESTSTRRSAA